MKTFTILKAKFIGADKSLGYRHGKVYKLVVIRHDWWFKFWHEYEIEIKRIDNRGWCPYASIYTFLKNWKIDTLL